MGIQSPSTLPTHGMLSPKQFVSNETIQPWNVG